MRALGANELFLIEKKARGVTTAVGTIHNVMFVIHSFSLRVRRIKVVSYCGQLATGAIHNHCLKHCGDQKRFNIHKYPLTYRNGISYNIECATKKRKIL